MGFIRKQEEKFARKMLELRYRQEGLPLPDEAALAEHAARVVDEAHRIAKERGGNVLSIVKEIMSSRR
jgi:hypothetical protein